VIRWTLWLALMAALAVVALVAPGRAQVPCVPREVMLRGLADQHGESRVGIGLAANGQVVEIWRNPDTGSWTITASTPAGVACMVASGEAFDDLDDPVPAAGEDG
jgi:hypothetical protein